MAIVSGSGGSGTVIGTDSVPKDFEKVQAYRMKDGRVLGKEEALKELRKIRLSAFFEGEISFPHNNSKEAIANFTANHGDEILRILQSSIKALD